jgi:hypothetical protein
MKAEDPLTEAQLREIAAAAEVFDRLAEEIAGATNGSAPHGAADGAIASDDPIGQQQLRAAAARTIDMFAGLFQQTFETYVDLAQSLVAPRGAGVGMSAGAATSLALGGWAGANAGATVWIHNTTAGHAAEVVLRLTDLTAHNGARIDAALARFVPAMLAVSSGASAASMLSLAIPPCAEPGIYYGHVLADGLPPAGLQVRLVVEGAQS